MSRAIIFVSAIFAILLFTGCSSSDATITTTKITTEHKVLKPKAQRCISKDSDGMCLVYEAIKDDDDLANDVSSGINNTKYVYNTKYQTMAQCPKDVELIQQSVTCAGCEPYVVSVRKTSVCAREKEK